MFGNFQKCLLNFMYLKGRERNLWFTGERERQICHVLVQYPSNHNSWDWTQPHLNFILPVETWVAGTLNLSHDMLPPSMFSRWKLDQKFNSKNLNQTISVELDISTTGLAHGATIPTPHVLLDVYDNILFWMFAHYAHERYWSVIFP